MASLSAVAFLGYGVTGRQTNDFLLHPTLLLEKNNNNVSVK